MTPEEVLGIRDVAGLRRLVLASFGGREMTLKEYEHIARLCDGYWMHDGDPTKPHAVLTSGLCSNGFIDSLRFLEYPNLAEIFAFKLWEKARQVYDGPVDWIIGSSYAAITFSWELARRWGATHGFTEKLEVVQADGTPVSSSQVWRRRFIPRGSVTMQGEELATTNKTTKEVRDALRVGNTDPTTGEVVEVTFAPISVLLVDRSVEGLTMIEDTPVVSLFRVEGIWAKPEAECPLCAQGSERIKKPKANWARLTGKAA